MTQSRPPKTLAEMAAETAAAEGVRGIRCRKCNCADWRVETTRRHDGMIVRYRICRHCGGRVTTTETPAS
jgi:hypothetical protein